MPPEGVPIKRPEPLPEGTSRKARVAAPDIGALFELLDNRGQPGGELIPAVQVLVEVVAEASSALRVDLEYYRAQCQAKDKKIADLEEQVAGLLTRSALLLGPAAVTMGETTV